MRRRDFLAAQDETNGLVGRSYMPAENCGRVITGTQVLYVPDIWWRLRIDRQYRPQCTKISGLSLDGSFLNQTTNGIFSIDWYYRQQK